MWKWHLISSTLSGVLSVRLYLSLFTSPLLTPSLSEDLLLSSVSHHRKWFVLFGLCDWESDKMEEKKPYGNHFFVAVGTRWFWLMQRNECSILKIMISFKILLPVFESLRRAFLSRSDTLSGVSLQPLWVESARGSEGLNLCETFETYLFRLAFVVHDLILLCWCCSWNINHVFCNVIALGTGEVVLCNTC